ncbi:MAG: ComEA family DNA-binding protein [Hyphomicrobiales bacterium]
MWGRELRAGLVFVLASLVIGTAVRAARRAHETRFQEIVARLEESEGSRLEREVGASRAAGEDSTDAGAAAPADRAATPARRAVAPARRAATPPPLRPASLDADRAGAAALERLPGIGPSLAARIVADRASRGPFGTPEGLLRVPGIGPKTLARIRPYLARGAAADSGDAPGTPLPRSP